MVKDGSLVVHSSRHGRRMVAHIIVVVAVAVLGLSGLSFSAASAPRFREKALASHVPQRALAETGVVVPSVTTDEFEMAVADGGPVVLDISSELCGPCKLMECELDRVSEQFLGQVQVLKVDLSIGTALAKDLGVRMLPSIFLFNKGSMTPVKSFAGLVKSNILSEAIRNDLLVA